MEVVTIKVSDIYNNANNASEALGIMVETYGDNTWHVPDINLHHALLGPLGTGPTQGGIAYVNAICNSNLGFGVNGGISGTITDIGQVMYNDMYLVMHELGHSLGAIHTHDLDVSATYICVTIFLIEISTNYLIQLLSSSSFRLFALALPSLW